MHKMAIQKDHKAEKMSYLNMLVMSIPTNIKFTGSQTLINLQVRGSVDITPRNLNVDTIITEMKFCSRENKVS
jgi:hypothetical protein